MGNTVVPHYLDWVTYHRSSSSEKQCPQRALSITITIKIKITITITITTTTTTTTAPGLTPLDSNEKEAFFQEE